MKPAIAAIVALTALFSSATAVAQPTITGVERRIGNGSSPYTEQQVSRIDGDIVVYEDTNGYDVNIWYFDLATGIGRPVTEGAGDRELPRVSDGVIVYTDFWGPGPSVHAYDVATGADTNLTADRSPNAFLADVSHGLVAWMDARNGTRWDIYALDLGTGGERRIPTPLAHNEAPAVDNGTIVWTGCDGSPELSTSSCHLFAYDWATKQTRQLTATPGRSDRMARVKDGRVVFWGNYGDPLFPVDLDIYLLDLQTLVETRLQLPNNQYGPHISGNVVSFDTSSSQLEFHVQLWHIPSGFVFEVPWISYPWLYDPNIILPSQQILNDIDGNRVTYTGTDARGYRHVYLYEFTLDLHVLSVNPARFDFGDVELHTGKSTCVNVTNTSAREVLVTPSLPAGASPPFLVGVAPSVVAAGATFCVPVIFQPVTTGPAFTDLTISAFNPPMALATVPLTGNGTGFGSIEVSPASYAFGNVEVGATKSALVTISNVSDLWPLTVTSIGLAAGSSRQFEIGLAPSCPFTLPPRSGAVIATADVELLFRPAAVGPASGVLDLGSNDPNHPLVTVTTTGTGVHTPAPGESAAAILAFFDQSVADGRLSGSGPGSSAKGRLGALRNMIQAAADLIAAGRYAEACQQLLDAYQRVDGLPRPPDFASGPAAAQLAAQILALRAQIGCQ